MIISSHHFFYSLRFTKVDQIQLSRFGVYSFAHFIIFLTTLDRITVFLVIRRCCVYPRSISESSHGKFILGNVRRHAPFSSCLSFTLPFTAKYEINFSEIEGPRANCKVQLAHKCVRFACCQTSWRSFYCLGTSCLRWYSTRHTQRHYRRWSRHLDTFKIMVLWMSAVWTKYKFGTFLFANMYSNVTKNEMNRDSISLPSFHIKVFSESFFSNFGKSWQSIGLILLNLFIIFIQYGSEFNILIESNNLHSRKWYGKSITKW